jgi:hypothetical protein
MRDSFRVQANIDLHPSQVFPELISHTARRLASIRKNGQHRLNQELKYASHLGLPAILVGYKSNEWYCNWLVTSVIEKATSD